MRAPINNLITADLPDEAALPPKTTN